MSTADVYVHPEVEAVIQLHESLFTEDFRRLSVQAQLEQQAQRLIDAHQSGNRAVTTHLTCWHPRLVGHSAEDILAADLSIQDARETLAREYGFRNWQDVVDRGVEPPGETFEQAVDAILAGDLPKLRRLLESRPSLVHERSSFGHRATLLHYVGCNGVETYRQVIPRNLADVARVLLEAGADVNATAEMYGGDCTTIALVITSAFPAEAGVADEVVQVLLDAGARTDNS